MSNFLAEYLWIHLGGMFGHHWTSANGDDPAGVAGAEWSFILHDLAMDQINTGLEACRRSGEEWPPSAPAFRARCLGIPSFAKVKADLHTRAHPFTRMVWEDLDRWALSQANQRDAERMVRSAYECAVGRRLEGAELPADPVAAIEHKPDPFKPCSEEARERAKEAVYATSKRAVT